MEPIKALHFKNLRFAGDPGRAADETELRRQAEALGAYIMRPRRRASVRLCLAGRRPTKEGSRRSDGRWFDPIPSPCRPARRSPLTAVAEITQRRWCRQSSGVLSEVFGGSTVILGPDGRVRYVIRKTRDGWSAEYRRKPTILTVKAIRRRGRYAAGAVTCHDPTNAISSGRRSTCPESSNKEEDTMSDSEQKLAPGHREARRWLGPP